MEEARYEQKYLMWRNSTTRAPSSWSRYGYRAGTQKGMAGQLGLPALVNTIIKITKNFKRGNPPFYQKNLKNEYFVGKPPTHQNLKKNENLSRMTPYSQNKKTKKWPGGWGGEE